MEPQDSSATAEVASTPVEVGREPTSTAVVFAQGIAIGIAASAVLVHVWLAIQLASMRQAYADFAGTLPALTALTTSPIWLWGVPAVGAGITVFLAGKRRNGDAAYLVLAAVLVATVVATWWFSHSPLRGLAGKIQS